MKMSNMAGQTHREKRFQSIAKVEIQTSHHKKTIGTCCNISHHGIMVISGQAFVRMQPLTLKITENDTVKIAEAHVVRCIVNLHGYSTSCRGNFSIPE